MNFPRSQPVPQSNSLNMNSFSNSNQNLADGNDGQDDTAEKEWILTEGQNIHKDNFLNASDFLDGPQNFHCLIHPGNRQFYFCMNCNLIVCCDCHILNGNHSNHTLRSIEEITNLKRRLIESMNGTTSLIQNLENRKSIISNGINTIDQLKNDRQGELTQIQNMFTSLSSSLNGEFKEKKEALTTQYEKYQREITSVDENFKIKRYYLNNLDNNELLSKGEDYIRSLEELSQSDLLKEALEINYGNLPYQLKLIYQPQRTVQILTIKDFKGFLTDPSCCSRIYESFELCNTKWNICLNKNEHGLNFSMQYAGEVGDLEPKTLFNLDIKIILLNYLMNGSLTYFNYFEKFEPGNYFSIDFNLSCEEVIEKGYVNYTALKVDEREDEGEGKIRIEFETGNPNQF